MPQQCFCINKQMILCPRKDQIWTLPSLRCESTRHPLSERYGLAVTALLCYVASWYFSHRGVRW